jgi:hypothetical protein
MGSPSERFLLPYMTTWMARLQWETNDKLGQ